MTKKREPGCTCHQEEGDSECVVHDPPTCKRCGCEYTMEWPDTEPTKYCNACAHAVVEAAEARAEKAEGEVARLRAALENAADDGHHAMCCTMLLYRGCTCHQAATLKALVMACPACDGEGAIAEDDGHRRRHCAKCDASGRGATKGDR